MESRTSDAASAAVGAVSVEDDHEAGVRKGSAEASFSGEVSTWGWNFSPV